jgi:PAS domain S-box-containing protein
LGERDRTLTKLRDSENRYRSLTEAAFEGICISENGIVLDMNDQGLKMFGYLRDEMIGKEILDLVAPESRPVVAEAIRAGQELIYGHQTLRKDGAIFYAEAQARMVRVGDRTLRMTALHDITERKQAEQALRESEEKFSKAFRASPDGLAISELETGRFIEVNEGYCRLYGHRRDEMLGHTSIELGIWENTRDRARLVAELKIAGRVREFEVRSRTRDGKLKIIHLSAETIELGGKSCFVSVLRDVTDRIRAEQALRESEKKFSKAFRTSPDVMSIADLETGHYLEVNEAHEKTFGFKRGEVIGRSPQELGIIENSTQREKVLAQLNATGSVRDMEIEARNRNGDLITVLHSAEMIKLGGRMCILRVSHDITDRKRAEAERRQAVEREQQSRIEYTLQLIAAQEAERKRIAAELHDSLGQNLLLIKNRAQMALMRGDCPAETREQLEGMSKLASMCITEARQISHDLHPQQLDHLGLTRALKAMIESASQASDIQFVSRLESVDELFPPDAAMNLYRIVQESLNNILKHSRAKHVDVRLERDIHEVQLRIEDDGCGFKTDQTGNGKGLGLKNIAERVRMLGGKLTVDSSPGQDTRIEVTIAIIEKPGCAS